MKNSSTYLRAVFLLLSSLFVYTSSYANHILGMDLYYTWVSGNTYKITMIIYGDCSPASNTMGAFTALPTDQPHICIFRGNTNVGGIDLNIEAPTTGVDITPVCPLQVGNTQCENPSSTIPGIMKFVYSANYTLPPPVTSNAWQFAFFGSLGANGSAGRSVNVTNINNANNTLIQLIDTLDNTIYPNNSSAQYSVIPTPFFCLNLADSYNPGAIPPAGDSLSVVNLIHAMDAPPPPMTGPPLCQFGNPVTYIGTAWNPPFTPISATTPLNVVAGSFVYDVTTGQLNFTPNQIQRSTVVYNVREFRGGSFVGSSQREMNFLVQNCSAPPPTGGLAGVTNGIIVDSAHMTTCGNSGPFSFFFNPHEPGTTNDITVDTSGVPAGAVINISGNGTPTPHVTFSWTSTGVPAGTYIFYLTYTDNNCPLQGTITTAISVTILPTSTVAYTVLSSIDCSSKEAINIIPGGNSSPWIIKVTGDTTQTFTNVTGNFIDSLSPGTDTISIAASTASRCDTIAVVTVPSPYILGDTIVCQGSTITLSDAVTGGSWSSGNTSIATVVSLGSTMGQVTGVSAGRVAITYFFPGGCFKTDTVTVKPLPAAIGGDMHVCTGLTTTLSDSLSGGIWTSGVTSIATIDSFSGVVTGVTANVVPISYTVAGCLLTTTVTVDKQPSFSSGSPNICTDGTATIVATPANGAWSSSNTSIATLTVIPPDTAIVNGIHTVSGFSIISYTLSGCTATRTISTVSNMPPITGPNKVCTGQSMVLSDAITGGTWTSANTSLVNVDTTSGTISGVSPGVPTIAYSIGGSCTVSTTITVNQSPDHGTITGRSNVCVGDTVMLSDIIIGGTWAITNDSASITAGVVTGIIPGRDTVLYIVSNPLCTDTVTKPITIYAVPNAGTIAGLQTLCVGTTTILSDTASGGVWSATSTTVATITSSGGEVVTGATAGIDTILYTVSNPGCSAVASYTVAVYNRPVPGVITGLDKVCAGAVFALSDTTGGIWSSGNVSVATINNVTGNVSALNSGATTVTYIIGPNAGRCEGVATFTLTVTPLNTLTIGSTVTQVTCYGDHNGGINIVVSGGTALLHYAWSNNDTIPAITGLAPGFDTVLVTEPSTLCRASDTFQITEPDTLVLSVGATQDKCKQGNGTVITTVTGGTQPYQYQWSDNSTGSNLENLHSGSYTVTVTDHNGCTQTASAEVTDNDCVINVHNAVTPNGDGINDTWVIEGIDNYPDNTVQVFDKWGDMVFEKTNYSNDWNGKGKDGKQVPDGTYFYLVKLNGVNLLGNQNTWTGSLFIKR